MPFEIKFKLTPYCTRGFCFTQSGVVSKYARRGTMPLLFISRERDYHLAVARRCARFSRRLFPFFFSDLGTDLSRGPSPRSGKCHCRFHRAIRNCRFVTSNWRRRYSECTCGTMNSDPPTTPTSTMTTTTIMWRGSRGGRVQRGSGRSGPLVPEAGERDRTIMLVLQSTKRRGYPAETLTLRPAKCQCESATEHGDNGEREIGIARGEMD